MKAQIGGARKKGRPVQAEQPKSNGGALSRRWYSNPPGASIVPGLRNPLVTSTQGPLYGLVQVLDYPSILFGFR